MNTLQKFRLSIFCGIIIFILIAIPGNFIPTVRSFKDWLQWDKIVHLIIFGILSFCILTDYSKQTLKNIKLLHYSIICLICLTYSGFTEWFQSLDFISRDGNLFDFFADSIGVFLGLFAFFLYRKTKNKISIKIFKK